MTKIRNEPQTPRRGWLKHGNPPGDFTSAPRCEAKTRRGTLCQGPAMPNGRCRMHGRPSTGPRTKEGLERSRKANWKTGKYSAKSKTMRKALRAARWVLEKAGIFIPRKRARPPSLASFQALLK